MRPLPYPDGTTLPPLRSRGKYAIGGDQDALLDEVEAFVTGSRRPRGEDRALATVLFTDIVGSTEKAVELGDAAWKDPLAEHDVVVRRALARHRGTEIDRTGDGFLATFDGPRARCGARGISRRRSRGSGSRFAPDATRVRSSWWTVVIRGIAVHIAARVMALAGPSDVLASSTVRDLVGGSGLSFEERGTHELRGVPGEWHLFAAVPS